VRFRVILRSVPLAALPAWNARRALALLSHPPDASAKSTCAFRPRGEIVHRPGRSRGRVCAPPLVVDAGPAESPVLVRDSLHRSMGRRLCAPSFSISPTSSRSHTSAMISPTRRGRAGPRSAWAAGLPHGSWLLTFVAAWIAPASCGGEPGAKVAPSRHESAHVPVLSTEEAWRFLPEAREGSGRPLPA
jgi:hypothetical protein